VKTAISISDDLFQTTERAAKRLGLSRSEVYQRAVAAFLERQRDTLVTDALNQIYRSEEPRALDPVLERMQRASLPRGDW
jgi:metal-responsive CopG/Arc/MetJ family transcriptional regulator